MSYWKERCFMEGKKLVIVAVIVASFSIDCGTLSWIHSLIYSIFVGNMGKGRHQNRKATMVAHQYSFIERMKQDYIVLYLTKYIDDYKRYMAVKKTFIIWMLLSPILLFLLCSFLPIYSYLIMKMRLVISFSTLMLFGFSHFDRSQKTQYDR